MLTTTVATAVRASAVLASALCHAISEMMGKAVPRLFQVMNGCEMQCGQAILAELDSVKRSIVVLCWPSNYKIIPKMFGQSQHGSCQRP